MSGLSEQLSARLEELRDDPDVLEEALRLIGKDAPARVIKALETAKARVDSGAAWEV